jgi:uncharacterized RDD family membrane protein YckC
VRPAGFWIRAVAGVVDLLVILVVELSLGFAGRRLWGASADSLPAFHGSVMTFTLLFSALYTTVLHARGGSTLGKLMVGARVVAMDGEPLSMGAAFLRWIGYFISVMTVGFGFLMAGLRRDKRALHDLIAGSRVERVVPRRRFRPAVPPPPPPVVTPRTVPAEPV